MGLDFSSNQKDSISLKSVHRYFEHGRDSASRKTYEKQSLFTLYRWWDSNPYGNARVGFRVLFALGTFVSAVAGDGSFGNGENPCAATDFGRADRY